MSRVSFAMRGEEDYGEDISPVSIARPMLSGRPSSSSSSSASSNTRPSSGGFDMMAQLHELQSQNETLLIALDRKERECEKLKVMAEESSAIAATAAVGSSGGPEAAFSKVLELAKKNRSVTVKLEAERTKSSRLTSEINALRFKIQDLEKTANTQKGWSHQKDKEQQKEQFLAELEGNVSSPSSLEDAEKVSKEWKDKVEKLNSKLSQEKLAQQQLKNDIAKLKALLSRELGDEVPLAKVTEEGSNWKGRSQQISLLKDKVKELKKQLSEAQAQALGSQMNQNASNLIDQILSGTVLMSPSVAAQLPAGGGAAGGPSAPSVSGMTVASSAPKSFDDMHREQVSNIEGSRKRDLDKLTLEVTERNEEISQLKKKVEAERARVKNLETYSQGLKSKIQVLLEKSGTDDKLVAALKTELENTRAKLRSGAPMAGPAAGPSGSRVSGSSNSAAVEELRKQNVELAETVRKQEQTIVSLRSDLQTLDRYSKTLQSIAGSSGSNPGAFDPVSDVSSRVLGIECDKLKEIIEMYKTKLAESEAAVQDNASLLRSERQKATELERKIQQIAASSSGQPAPPAPANLQDKLQASADRLEIQMDENKALKASIRSMQQNKEAELRVLKEMLEKQRESYETAIQNLKRSLAASGASPQPQQSQAQPSSARASSASRERPPQIPARPGSAASIAASVATAAEERAADLLKQNESLRKELTELKTRYNSLVSKSMSSSSGSSSARRS